MHYQFGGMPPIRMNLMLWNLYTAEPLSSAEAPAGYPNKSSCNTSCPPSRFLFLSPSLPATQRGLCGRESCRAARVTYKLPRDLPSVHVRKSVKLDSLKWQIQGRGPAPPLFLDQKTNWGRGGDQPPPLTKGLDDRPPYL